MHLLVGVIQSMAFVPINVQPLSLWSAFTLENSKKVEKMIPQNMELVPIQLYKGMKPQQMLLFNSYYAESTFFNGHRLEVNVICKDKEKQTTHFVVLDCYTNSLNWDPIHGVRGPNAKSYQTRRKNSLKKIECKVNTDDCYYEFEGYYSDQKKPVNTRFAVDSNYKCYYRDSPSYVMLQFNPTYIAHDICPLQKVKIDTNIGSNFKGKYITSFVHPNKMTFTAFC